MKDKYIIDWTVEDLKLLQDKDPKTFEKLYFAYRENIFTYLILKLKGNSLAAEEILSDTFHSAFTSARGLKNNKNILGWLITIANRRYNDYLRKLYREKKFVDHCDDNSIIPAKEEDQEISDRREKALLMYSAMENLNPMHKEILKLKYIDGKSREEIAKLKNKTTKAIENIIFRAKEELKKEIKKLSDEIS